MLRLRFVLSATTFSSYNPDNAKTGVVYQIGLAAEDETPKSLDERRNDQSISHL